MEFEEYPGIKINRKFYWCMMIITFIIGGCFHKVFGTQDKEYILRVQFKSKSQCLALSKKYIEAGFESDCKVVDHE